MQNAPHHTDVPFQKEERYKENIKQCVLWLVDQEARVLSKDPQATKDAWLEAHGEVLDDVISNDSLPAHLRFNMEHIRARVEAQVVREDSEAYIESVGFGD